MIKSHRSLFVLSLLIGSQMAAGVAAVRAGDFTLENTKDFKGAALDEGRFTPSHLIITGDARVGYDDNTLAQTDGRVTTRVFVPATQTFSTVTANSDTSDSLFFNFDVGAGYTLSTPRAKLAIGADIGVNYYVDRPGRNYDINGAVTGTFTYKLTPRAVFDFSTYNAYTSEPDFGASNLTGFNGSTLTTGNNIAGVTAGDRSRGDFFYTTDRFALTYQLTQRFSTVTGYDLVAFAYLHDPYATIEDRVEHYFSEQLRFLVSPLATAVLEYRFGYIDYFDVNNDSIQNFALIGADFNLSQRLKGSFRVGSQIRDYNDFDNGGLSPYVEASLNYSLSQLASVNFIARYSDEEGNITATDSSSNTLRLGVAYNQAFGARLSAYISFFYTHSDFEGPDTLVTTPVTFADGTTGTIVPRDFNGNTAVQYPGNFSENTFDVGLGLRYSINRILSVEVGYTHTTVLSGIDFREYERNRYFGGVRVAF